MAKRRATTELNRDNWDQEDEKEEMGTFKRLSEDELKHRVIKKAKRVLVNAETESSGSSPFAAFSGFTKTASIKNPFSFLKNSVENKSTADKMATDEGKKENGSASTKEKTEEMDITSTAQKSASDLATRQTSASDLGTKKPIRSMEYYRQLQSLNESVMKWMQLHLSKNSCCDFTPVFNDYKKHLDTLNFTYPVKVKEFPEGQTNSQSSISSEDSSFAMKTDDKGNHHFKVSNSHKKSDDETDYGANFKSNTTNTSTFSFGIKRTPTATSSISSGPTSSVRNDAAPLEKKTFQFSFGLKNSQLGNSEDSGISKPFTFASSAAEKTADSESAATEEEYVPPKNEFVAVKEEDAFYSKRCKLFYKKDDTYVERGIGTLHLKPLDGKTQLLIRADTSLGNILLNIILSDSLPLSKTGKNNVLLVCIPNPPIDAKKADSKEPIPMLIRVKTSEDADELLETLNKHKS